MASYKNILDDFFLSVTSFGFPSFYVLILLIIMRFDIVFALYLLASFVFIELTCIIIKLVYRKERPVVQSRKGFYNTIDANSFPSVHSARVAFLATLVIVLYNKDIFFILLSTIFALLVGYSRIYLKRHFFSDVIAGFLIGTITAFATLYF